MSVGKAIAIEGDVGDPIAVNFELRFCFWVERFGEIDHRALGVGLLRGV